MATGEPEIQQAPACKTGISERTFSASFGYSSPRTGEHEIDAPAAALRTHQQPDPIAHRQIGAVASNLFGRVGLDPMPAIAAPNNQPHLRSGRAAERCRRTGVGFHRADPNIVVQWYSDH